MSSEYGSNRGVHGQCGAKKARTRFSAHIDLSPRPYGMAAPLSLSVSLHPPSLAPCLTVI